MKETWEAYAAWKQNNKKKNTDMIDTICENKSSDIGKIWSNSVCSGLKLETKELILSKPTNKILAAHILRNGIDPKCRLCKDAD